MEINHSTHPHPLFLREPSNTEDVCFICRESINGNPFYVCEDCTFYLHKWCAEFPPTSDHPFHPQHPLRLRHGEFCCYSCHKMFRDTSSFRCNKCDFDLDVVGALMPEIKLEGKEFIQHFSHQHQLTLCSQDHDKLLTCFACKKITSELVYGCIPCGYFLHKSCSQLPTPILHALHPQHALHLQVKLSLCQICKAYDHTFKFSCGDCFFSMDVSCWMEIWLEEGELLEKACFLCSKQHLDSISCVDSKYLLNPTCIWLQEEINHQFHSHKPLQLLAPKDFCCDSCHQWFDANSSYGCHECNFHMNVGCALMPMIQLNEREKYLSRSLPFYFRHPHPLVRITRDFGIICSFCHKCRPSPIYGCLQCEYFLHHSCIELPSEIETPLHDLHKLTLQLVGNECCHLCLKQFDGLSFGCIDCAFYIEIECYFSISKLNVQYTYHEHPLCLVEKSYCKKCVTSCGISPLSSEMKLTQEYSLRCLQCYYNLHLVCSQLPCIIKDRNHMHSLTLTESVVEEDCDDYYCDICEEVRDPRLCVYWCKDCDFVSHVHCVLSEILNAWKKDQQIELRSARDLNLEEVECKLCYNESGKVMTLKNVLDSLSEDETKEIEDIFQGAKLHGEDKDYSKTKDEGTSKYEGNDIIQQLSTYNKVGISDIVLEERFMQFQLGSIYHIQPCEYELEVVEVEDCMITSNFAPLLSALFKKYGDFSAATRFEKQFKSVIFYLFCRTLDEMCRTCIADLTEWQHTNWFYYWKGAGKLGFDVKFVIPFLQRSLISLVGLQAMKLEEELPGKLVQEIAALEKNILEIKSQIEIRKSYLSQYDPHNYVSHDFARKNKWRKAAWDII